MSASYAVVWREPGAVSFAGKLELRPRELLLEGGGRAAPAACEIPYAELRSMRVGRSAGERLDGRPTLIIERSSGGPISIASLLEGGLLLELADLVVQRVRSAVLHR